MSFNEILNLTAVVHFLFQIKMVVGESKGSSISGIEGSDISGCIRGGGGGGDGGSGDGGMVV